MRAARIRLGTQIVMDDLGFPQGTKVKACFGERVSLGQIELIVEHDDLPDIPQGQVIPEYVPVWVLNADGKEISFSWGSAKEPEETAVLRRFYDDVCREAELKMAKTGRLEGAHYAAMKAVLAERGVRI